MISIFYGVHRPILITTKTLIQPWENANMDNIEQFVIEVAKAWLIESQAIYNL
jgi:hypothetical protein